MHFAASEPGLALSRDLAGHPGSAVGHFEPLGFAAGYRALAPTYLHILRKLARSGVRAAAPRTQANVAAMYEDTWARDGRDALAARGEARDIVFVDGRPVRVDRLFLARSYALAIVQALRHFGVTSALEVGCGRGQNLAALATRAPALTLFGLEPTGQGAEQSRRLFAEPPARLDLLGAPQPLGRDAHEALARISLLRGDGRRLPLADASVDAAFTTLVLEQIPSLYADVVREMRRVARRVCVFIEPFAEANGPLGSRYCRSLDYFQGRYREFGRLGLEPVYFTTAIPQKPAMGVGLLVARVAD